MEPQLDINQEQEEHEEDLHIDEKWLVSYSDMMTLLFGFFVMMYVLSINSKEKIEQSLQQISKEGFNNELQEKTQKKIIDNLNSQKNNNSVEEVLIELKIKEEQLKSQKDELLEIKNSIVEKETKLKTQSEDLMVLKNNFEAAEKEKNILIQEKKSFEEQLKMKDEEIKLLSRAKNSQDLNKIKDLEKDNKIKSLQDEIAKTSQLKSTNSQNIKNFNKEKQSLNEKIEDLLAKNIQLEERLKQKPKEQPQAPSNQRFMMILVQWTTEKHDVDMIIEDPKGNVFNYKKRKINSTPGEFVIDSRMGPGIETWIADKIVKGDYKVKIKLYNQYGNKEDALVKASIYSNLSVKNTEVFKLNNNLQQKEKTIIIHAEEDGTFTLN